MAAPTIFYRPMVRPWALAAPVAVLLLCVPLLRPLRQPTALSVDEALRLATIRALLDHGSLNLTATPTTAAANASSTSTTEHAAPTPATTAATAPGTDEIDVNLSIPAADLPESANRTAMLRHMILSHGRLYSEQPPVMALILAPITWLLEHLGLVSHHDPASGAYVLTLLCVTMPVALGAGMIYRMGRLLELPRHWRAGLALATVLASGLICFATVLNAHAPAAALLLLSAAMLLQVETGTTPAPATQRALWLLLCGGAASLAAVLDPPAAVVAVLIFLSVPATRFGGRWRIAGVLVFLIGAAPPLLLHAQWNVPITGDLLPAEFHRELALIRPVTAPPPIVVSSDSDEQTSSALQSLIVTGDWLYQALFGFHGILSHFPFVLLGLFGIVVIMHRHWPAHVKCLAAASVIAAIAIIGGYCWARADWRGQAVICPWFVCFLPLLTFWSGAWLRRPHPRWAWIIAALLLAYSCAVALYHLPSPALG
jgi:hypothetical protein